MSSLAAARSDNFYFPPDYDGRIHGGLSKFNGSKGANQWEQQGLIRFEMPMDAWCLACERHMSRGLRFNAKKDKIGKYLSTILYSFTMKCPSCANKMVIKTDPENDNYDFSEGIRKMEQDYTPDIEDGVIDILSDETKFQLANDPIFLMQHNLEGKIKVQTANERLEALIDLKESNSKLDYDVNSIMRANNREKKQLQKMKNKESLKFGINVPLLDTNDDDNIELKSANFALSKSQRNVGEKRNIVSIINQSIFADDNKKRKSNKDFMKKGVVIKIDNFKPICNDKDKEYGQSNVKESIIIKSTKRKDLENGKKTISNVNNNNELIQNNGNNALLTLQNYSDDE